MENKSAIKSCYFLKDAILRHSSGFELNIPHFEVFNGESIGFYGPNGSGKSTLLKLLAFLSVPDSGNLKFNNKRVVDVGEFQRDVSYLMQDPYLLKRTVFENIAYGLRKRRDVENLTGRVHHAMELVALDPSRFASRKWYELSGGSSTGCPGGASYPSSPGTYPG